MNSIFIFPLPLILMPNQILPLKIFEQKYLFMTKECIKNNEPFGINYKYIDEENNKDPLLDTIGCTANIVEWDMPELGIFLLQTKGKVTYEINSFKNLSNGLIEAKVNYLTDYETETDEYEEKKEILETLVKVSDNINKKLLENKITFQKIDQNIRDLTYNLTSIISFENKFKQMILHEREDIKRAKILVKELTKIGLAK